jgi:hypothetical protein
MKRTAIHIILIFFISQTGISQSTCIKGYIYNKKDTSAVIGAYIIPFVDNKIISTDENGFFEICDLKPGNYTFGITLMGYKDTTISNMSLTYGKSVYLTLYLSECPYHILGKNNICPVCEKSDMVVPILYETVSKRMIKSAKKGNAYLGGHRTGCDPTFYCKRDSLKY